MHGSIRAICCSPTSSATGSVAPMPTSCSASGTVTRGATGAWAGISGAGARKRRARLTGRAVQIRERSPHHYDARIAVASPPYLLRGYYQTEQYFAAVADEIDAAIRLPEVPTAGLGPTVAVSYRRGDYVGEPWLLPMRFQERALAWLCRGGAAGHRRRLLRRPGLRRARRAETRALRPGPGERGAGARAHARGDGRVRPPRDLELVVRAWWAAWLAERRSGPDRPLVIAPDGWMFRGRSNDVIPDRWVRRDWE